MNTTELFDFSFVDRNREKEQFKNFMSDANGSILWISGKRGIGKTQFIKHMINDYKEYAFCYYNVGNDCKKEDILTEFINVLQNKSKKSFIHFVQKGYKACYNHLGTVIKEFSSKVIPDISYIVSAILDISNYVETKADERREATDVIQKYIINLLTDSKLFICIDNFSRCTRDVMDIFFDVFKIVLNNSSCRICVIRTTDDMNDEEKLWIRSSLPNIQINIEEFKDVKYFYQILNPIFDMSDFTEEDIKYIYNKCMGEPHKLSIVISKLLDKNGIIYNKTYKKAIIDKNILKNILSKEQYIKYSETDFSVSQKWIIFSFLCLYDGVDAQDVMALALYIAKCNLLYYGYDEKQFSDEFAKLVLNNQLLYDGDKIRICHDADYIDYMDIFQNSPVYAIFSKNAYEFIKNTSPLCEREDLVCRHMREANIPDWQKANYAYGEKLYNKQLFYDAHKIFLPLLNDLTVLDKIQLLNIAIDEYEIGNFKTAIKVLETIDINLIETTDNKYKALFYLAKSIYNFSGDISKAVGLLKESLKYISKKSEYYVQTMNILQMYYIEMPNRKEAAEEIFKEIRDEYRELYPEKWASTMRGCHNFINDKDEALNLLEDAINCTNNALEKAYIETTKGFVYIRSGNLDAAKDKFEKSYNDIKEMKKHESSYAANNLAVCYMMKGEYSKAKEILEETYFWNRTNYGKIVLNVHLMICNVFLKNRIEAEKSVDFLYNYLDEKKPKDSIMLRKIYLNLAVAHKELGQLIMYEKCLENACEYAKGTSSEWRCNVIQQNITEKAPTNLYYSFAVFDPWFLVYAHD